MLGTDGIVRMTADPSVNGTPFIRILPHGKICISVFTPDEVKE